MKSIGANKLYLKGNRVCANENQQNDWQNITVRGQGRGRGRARGTVRGAGRDRSQCSGTDGDAGFGM